VHCIHEQEQTLLGDHSLPEGRGLFDLRGLSERCKEGVEEVSNLRIAEFALRIL
jgi:hypothetical protein